MCIRDSRWEITKQKAGGHEGASGTYDFLYKHIGIDRAAHSVAVAADYGAGFSRSGSWYYYKEEKIGQGAAAAAEYAIEHGLLEEIEEATLRAAGVRCRYG